MTPTPNGSPTPFPTSSPTPVPSVHGDASRFVFAIIDFEADGGFFGGSINANTGTVTPLTNNPFSNTLGQNIVIQVVADPAGRFLYSLNIGASSFGIQFGKPGINEYKINRNSGTLEPVANGDVVFTSGRHDAQIAIDGRGRFLYQPNGSGTDIYAIDQSSGLLTLTATSSTAVPVGNVSATSPDGRFYFNAGSGVVAAFSINQSNGQLAPAGAPVSTGGTASALLVSPDSTLLFVASSEGSLSVFRIGVSRTLTPVSGSPFMIDPQAEIMSITGDERFLYIASGVPDTGNVKGYALNPGGTGIAAIPGAFIPNGTSINLDGSSKFAYISLNMQLSTFQINPANGALTQVSTSGQVWTDDPTDIVVTP